MAKINITSYLDDLERYIKTDIIEIINYHEFKNKSRKRKCGHDSIASLIFCCIDYLGLLVYGRNDSNNAIKYIENFFDDSYREKASLIYTMWRHGTVHENDPKILADGVVFLGWCSVLLSADHNKREHLRVFSIQDNKVLHYLVLNLNKLAEDLLGSIKQLKVEITNNGSRLGGKVRKHYENSLKPATVSSNDKLQEQFKKAIVGREKDRFMDAKGHTLPVSAERK